MTGSGLNQSAIPPTVGGFPQWLDGSSILGGLYRLMVHGDVLVNRVWQQSMLGKIVNTLRDWMYRCVDSSLFFKVLGRWAQQVPCLSTIPFLPVAIGLFFLLACLANTGLMAMAMCGLAVLALLDGLIYRRCWLNHLTVIDAWVVLYFASALVATCFSSVQPHSMFGLGKIILFVLGYGVFRQCVAFQPVALRWLLAWLVVLGLWQAGVGYLQLHQQALSLATWQDPNINPELKLTRIFGTLKPLNPNLLAGFLVPVAGMALHWAGVRLYDLLQSISRQTVIMAALWAAIAVMLLWATAATGSRGAYLAIAAMAGTVFMMHGHWLFRRAIWPQWWLKVGWVMLAVGMIVGVLGLLATSDALRHRVMSIFSMYEDSSIAYRFHVYQASWRMIVDNWLLGIGPGNQTFTQIYGLYQTPGYNALGTYSVPLEIWVEQGILGLIAYAGLLLTVLLRWLHGLDSQMNGRLLSLGLACFVALVGVFVYGWFDTVWYRPIVQWESWLLLACFSVVTLTASREERV